MYSPVSLLNATSINNPLKEGKFHFWHEMQTYMYSPVSLLNATSINNPLKEGKFHFFSGMRSYDK
jgi:hypothetical protein